ncbi:MAG: hypothetical protein A3E87_10945 [Gammaproteobacteria bacterium RIFCSPHIGHO2_12_FULL_35_23]|nr:MAG: hypothetical protein A3E87_10945 [Gammaproteobacteria bacterium RIFCSPHIGHO2_12_FULL_35_23]
MKRAKRLKKLPNDTVYDEIDSPVGKLVIFASSQGVHSILWDKERFTKECKQVLLRFKQNSDHKIIIRTKQQVTEYFQGKRKKFELPLVFDGTPFQIQAWKELYKIPYGQTISYAEQARRVGNKNKARAVGLANGLNPISIIVPCHRVLGSNGQLTGFGGGIENKKLLLQLEKNVLGKNND